MNTRYGYTINRYFFEAILFAGTSGSNNANARAQFRLPDRDSRETRKTCSGIENTVVARRLLRSLQLFDRE